MRCRLSTISWWYECRQRRIPLLGMGRKAVDWAPAWTRALVATPICHPHGTDWRASLLLEGTNKLSVVRCCCRKLLTSTAPSTATPSTAAPSGTGTGAADTVVMAVKGLVNTMFEHPVEVVYAPRAKRVTKTRENCMMFVFGREGGGKDWNWSLWGGKGQDDSMRALLFFQVLINPVSPQSVAIIIAIHATLSLQQTFALVPDSGNRLCLSRFGQSLCHRRLFSSLSEQHAGREKNTKSVLGVKCLPTWFLWESKNCEPMILGATSSQLWRGIDTVEGENISAG